MPRTVLIVDDHPEFRAYARTLLEAEGWHVIGEAGDGASALVAARELEPELVLLDVQLPDVDGFTVCKQMAEAGEMPVVILTSGRDESSHRRRLRGSSAQGFIAKAELSGSLVAALADSG